MLSAIVSFLSKFLGSTIGQRLLELAGSHALKAIKRYLSDRKIDDKIEGEVKRVKKAKAALDEKIDKANLEENKTQQITSETAKELRDAARDFRDGFN